MSSEVFLYMASRGFTIGFGAGLLLLALRLFTRLFRSALKQATSIG